VAVSEESLEIARTAIRTWQQAGVLTHGLCPFAHGPAKRDSIHIQAAEAKGLESAAAEAVLAAHALLDHEDTDTTLVVFPFSLDDFDDFLDVIDACEGYLEERELETKLQIASFHPEYRFEGTAADDATNFTNRSPLPVLQWLRFDQVAAGIDSYGETESIPERNMAQREALRALPQSEVQTEVAFEGWEAAKSGHYCVSKARVCFGLEGISSTRVFAAETVISPGPWTLHIRSGEVLSP
jgi:hypothetical protein